MKNIILALFISCPVSAVVLRQNGGNASSISASTITVPTGTGSACFSADNPTLVVNCNSHSATFGGAGALILTPIAAPNPVTTGAFYFDNSLNVFRGSLDGSTFVTLATGSVSGNFINLNSPAPGVQQSGGFNVSSNSVISGNLTISGSSLTVTGAGGIGVTYGVTAGSVTITNTVTGADFTVNTSTLVVIDGKVGIGTASPGTTLDVNGSAQFGSTAKSTFSATGSLTMASGAMIATTSGTVVIQGSNSELINQVPGFSNTPGSSLFQETRHTGGTKIIGWRVDNAHGWPNIDGNIGGTTWASMMSFDITNNRIGISTQVPTTTLDVNGDASFGTGAAKSTFTTTGYFLPYQRTLAQIQALTPATGEVGGVISCSNCARTYDLCVATGTTLSGFRLMSGTTGCQ